MNELLQACDVALAAGFDGYAANAPFAPDVAWPEYPFAPRTIGTAPNPAYAAVRSALCLLGRDAAHYGTGAWNPLGTLIRPGETVLLKPNFVRDFRETQPGDADCLITHGAVLRALADYVYIALGGRGRIVIADAPQNDADFAGIERIVQLAGLQAFYRDVAGFTLEVVDLRPECARKINGVIVGHSRLPGDPEGYVAVDLGPHSAFAAIAHLCHRLYGAEYDMGELRRHHTAERHEYLVSRSVLSADVVISVPKLKTHKKTGLTVNLKNLVGINGNKNWLPHHREGTPAEGGDQFAADGMKNRIERLTVAQFKRLFPLLGPLRGAVAGPIKRLGQRLFGDTNTDRVRSGNWYGNDTTWRMVLDLNRILFYADASGRLHDRPVRRLFSVVDAIVGGEGNGPLDPTPRRCGMVLAGGNPVAVDLVAGRIMGFDPARLPVLVAALQPHDRPLVAFGPDDVRVRSNARAYDRPLGAIAGPCLEFKAHFGWRGHCEIGCQAGAAG